jgi:hypothetical protein
MKTREQAEARAMELFPDQIATTAHLERKAFIKCFDEMQEDKQTCGFCVEPKQEEEKPQPQEKVLSEKEYLLDNLKEFPNHDEYDPKLIDAISDFMNGFANYRLNTIQDNGLREAAKRVVLMIERDIAELENPNNSIGGMCTVRGKLATIKGYKDELEKALK